MSRNSCDVGTGAMSFHVVFIFAVCVVYSLATPYMREGQGGGRRETETEVALLL
jgi:hypothetical protein